jgi:hypothetical protein
MSTHSTAMPKPGSRALFNAVLIAVCAGLVAGLSWYGYDFYVLDVSSRVDHEQYDSLSPARPLGHGYGIAGTLLILTNLLYLPRRRFPQWRVGSMRAWLDMHVATGLTGSILILFHSAFQVRALIALVTAASLLLVVVTGVIGRYLYAIAPKPDPDALDGYLGGLDQILPGIGARLGEVMKGIAKPPSPGSPSLPRAFVLWRKFARAGKRRREAVMESFREQTRPRTLGRDEERLAADLARKASRAAEKEYRAEGAALLLRSWRGLHRYLALLMVLSVVVHIAVAVYFGYWWVFSQSG